MSVPCTCWLIPMPQKIIAERARAKVRATVRMVPASMPQTSAIFSGANPATVSASASKFSVNPAMYCLSAKSSSTITCMIAFNSATSVPGRNCSMWVAWRDSAWPRGSATIRVAPRLAAFFR